MIALVIALLFILSTNTILLLNEDPERFSFKTYKFTHYITFGVLGASIGALLSFISYRLRSFDMFKYVYVFITSGITIASAILAILVTQNSETPNQNMTITAGITMAITVGLAVFFVYMTKEKANESGAQSPGDKSSDTSKD